MTEDRLAPAERTRANEIKRRVYAKEAPKYDREADFVERRLFGTEHRGWACSQATGATLEVAIGTGLNLGHYAADVRLIGLDLSPEMLALAETRAKEMGRTIGLTEGDAQDLAPEAPDPLPHCILRCRSNYAVRCRVPAEARRSPGL